MIVTYQNACMIVNKQFIESDEEWEHNGKRYKARAIANKNIDEHTAMLSMLPSHYLKETTQILKTLPNENSITFSDEHGNEFKMVKHKGKIYYCLIINEFLPKSSKILSYLSLDNLVIMILFLSSIEPFDSSFSKYLLIIVNRSS